MTIKNGGIFISERASCLSLNCDQSREKQVMPSLVQSVLEDYVNSEECFNQLMVHNGVWCKQDV